MYYSSAAIHHGLPRELVTSKALASSGRCRHRGKSGRALVFVDVSAAAPACGSATFRGGDGRGGTEQPLCPAEGFYAECARGSVWAGHRQIRR